MHGADDDEVRGQSVKLWCPHNLLSANLYCIYCYCMVICVLCIDCILVLIVASSTLCTHLAICRWLYYLHFLCWHCCLLHSIGFSCCAHTQVTCLHVFHYFYCILFTCWLSCCGYKYSNQ